MNHILKSALVLVIASAAAGGNGNVASAATESKPTTRTNIIATLTFQGDKFYLKSNGKVSGKGWEGTFRKTGDAYVIEVSYIRTDADGGTFRGIIKGDRFYEVYHGSDDCVRCSYDSATGMVIEDDNCEEVVRKIPLSNYTTHPVRWSKSTKHK